MYFLIQLERGESCTHYCAYYAPTNKNQPFPLCTRYNEAR
jgi:hypothetical protein